MKVAARMAIAFWIAAATGAGACDDYEAFVAPGQFTGPGVGESASAGEAGLMPCAVEEILARRCQRCHASIPKGGAPMPLMTWADLQAPSSSRPGVSVADEVVARISDPDDPMPPPPSAMLSADEVAVVATWVSAGAPQEACADGPVGPLTPPPSTGAAGLLPCDVEQLLADHCRTCHTDPPRQDAPMPLLTREDLLRPAPSAPDRTVAALAVLRMRDLDFPMPPGAASTVAPARVDAFEAWVAAGAPAGDCAPVADPFDVAATCTSGEHWDRGDKKDRRMNPGRACIGCHTEQRALGEDDAPALWVGGTVYPTAHEPDLCYGTEDARVEITDARGRVYRLKTEDSGNFSLEREDADGFTYPFTAKVLWQGRERVMNTPQMTGDCNGCHTQWGHNDAPGRILLP